MESHICGIFRMKNGSYLYIGYFYKKIYKTSKTNTHGTEELNKKSIKNILIIK